MANRIREIRKSRGWSMERLAEAANTTRQQIYRLERGDRRLTLDWMQRIAAALGCAPGDLIDSRDQLTGGKDVLLSGVARGKSTATADLTVLLQDVPVYGTAAGSLGEGAFQMQPGEVIERVRRPPALSTARDVYALYVQGTSMEPRYEEGELIYVSARRPARPGDYVVVQVQNGDHAEIQAYIKRLARRCAEKIVLEQLNPPATIEIPAPRVRAVHKVLSTNDLFGV